MFYLRLGMDPKDPTIYGSGSFAAPTFGFRIPGLVGQVGPPNHLGNRLTSVNLTGNRVSWLPSTSIRLVRSVILRSPGLPELRSQGDIASLGLAQGFWVWIIWVLSNGSHPLVLQMKGPPFLRLPLRYPS
jgi:hypothetical protein